MASQTVKTLTDATFGDSVKQGVVLVDCARKVIKEMAGRAARIWNVPEEGVEFSNGSFRPAGANVGEFQPLTIADIARKTTSSEGAIAARHLAQRLPGLRLIGGEPQWHDSLILRGVKALPVALN